MPHIGGRELLAQIREQYPDIPVIVVTGTTDIAVAVECMRLGSFDYLVKAVERSKLVGTVLRAMELRNLSRENSALRRHLVDHTLEHPEHFSEIVTRDSRMLNALLYVESVAISSQTVLVSGETGSGKELVARAIHKASGRTGEMVSVNIAGLDESMFADTLFGHLKGSYTGADQVRRGLIEKAAGGTLFLDEIGDLALGAQIRLLRLLESREYYPLGSDSMRRSDARVVVATNRDLQQEMDQGRFRKDLYYRLRTHHVRIPPLRERPQDITLLVEQFAREAAADFGKPVPRIPANLQVVVRGYQFPGNVRELRSMVFDAVSRHRSGDLPLDAFSSATDGSPALVQETPTSGDHPVKEPARFPTLREATGELIQRALDAAGGNQARAARLLGITPQALSQRLKSSRP
jgi:DNA-binding NtrC family response regulator